MDVLLDEPKILVVDDEPLIRKLLKDRLAVEGYFCSEACDASEAMNKIRESQPDLVILDIMMPGKSGNELVPEIQSEYPDTGIIMATAVADPSVIIDCMKNGADDYISKPFDLNHVVNSVNKVLDMKRLELKIRLYQSQLEHTVDEQKKQIRETFLHSVESLVSALEAKDEYTGGHSRRVAKLSLLIGGRLGLSTEQLEDLQCGALLHDVGKVAINPAVQNKPGALTPSEYKHMMTHSIVGAGIVKPVASQMVIEIIAHHHDRFDGKGLDQVPVDGGIPLGAEIVAVADSFDAMTSDRPYRRRISREEAVAEINRCSGTQFSPEIVAAFLAIIDGYRGD
jgi:response regulator RpfG family c-di-GMP phosphodiesterase